MVNEGEKRVSTHPSHQNVRFSDASTFDFVCDDCGATDNPLGLRGSDPNGDLAKPCSKPQVIENPSQG